VSFLKSSAIVSGSIFVSRIFGFVRDQLIAFLLGASFAAEAFFVAQRLPNLFRALFAEGAFSSAFVPLFSDRSHQSGFGAALDYARQVYAFLTFFMAAFCAVCMIAMPWLIGFITPGFRSDPENLALVIELTRICFPYLGLVSLVALFSSMLNTMGHYVATAIAPVATNLVIIAASLYVWLAGLHDATGIVRLLAYAVLVAGALQLAIVAVAAMRLGMAIVPGVPRVTPDVLILLRKCLPGLVSGGISQFNLIVAMAVASTMPGAVAYLYYAEKIIDLPLSVIGAALSLVLLPSLSRLLHAKAPNDLAVVGMQNRAIELALLFSIPATAALVILAEPVIRAVFQHGAFSASDTSFVAPALMGFAIGLPAFNAARLLQLSAVARANMILPMNCAIASAIINLLGCLLLPHVLGHVGIAVATSLAAWFNLALLYITCRRRDYFRLDSRTLAHLPRILAATTAMSACIWFLANDVLDHALSVDAPVASSIIALATTVLAGLVVFVAAAAIMGLLKWKGAVPAIPSTDEA
jgi:putative peptidoglycan lipid II flippase